MKRSRTLSLAARASVAPLILLSLVAYSAAQNAPATPLDPTRSVTLTPVNHVPLSEEYLWTSGDVTARRPDHSKFPWNKPDLRLEPHGFRKSFHLTSVPSRATLYLAGPREATLFINGQRVEHLASDPDAPINFRVFHADVAAHLHAGNNTLAIEAVRGRGVVSATATQALQQLTYGEVLAVKLVGARFGEEAPVLLRSDSTWRSAVLARNASANTQQEPPPWTGVRFDDAAWKPVVTLGPVDSNRDFLQWSADAGMYAWPGYMGMTSPLGTYPLLPAAVTHVFNGPARFEHLEALTTGKGQPFTVVTPPSAQSLPDAESPALLLDFGREVAGRLLVVSATDTDARLSVTYGESELEALATGLSPNQRGGNYLGSNLLDVPARGIARSPKSAFRFVRIRFLRGAAISAFRSLRLEGIAYPVTYAGSFQSSDPLLNRIWETGAYTAHLCMQDDLWDAPKRDRGRWAGDIDVEGRVISTAFGDKALLERTLAALVPEKEGEAVNGIPGYSALWITSLANLYAHAGDLDYLRAQQQPLLRILRAMDGSLDAATGLYVPGKGHWPFVDWSPGLYGVTPAAIFGTSLQYLRGYRAAAVLLTSLGDTANATRVNTTADRLQAAVLHAKLLGHTWQLNALGVQTGLFDTPATQGAVWRDVLAHVKQDSSEDQAITPYFNASVLDAMSELGHTEQTLDWIRTYWGGMLAEGATSFWEAYDLRWPKDTPHLSLQADGTSGFFVSMAHGWSAGPVAWLSENILGVRDARDGFRTVTIAPHLTRSLSYAKGMVPTPHGAISVSLSRSMQKDEALELEIPQGVEQATIVLDSLQNENVVLLNGKPFAGVRSPNNEVRFPALGPGKYRMVFQPKAPGLD